MAPLSKEKGENRETWRFLLKLPWGDVWERVNFPQPLLASSSFPQVTNTGFRPDFVTF
jgi:hypothetical protein